MPKLSTFYEKVEQTQRENIVRKKFEYGDFHITNAKKSCQNHESRNFGMSAFENPISYVLTFPISQYSQCWKLQIKRYVAKTHEIALKWLSFSWKLNSCSHLTTIWRFFLKFVRTWQIIQQFRWYSSFLQCHIQLKN